MGGLASAAGWLLSLVLHLPCQQRGHVQHDHRGNCNDDIINLLNSVLVLFTSDNIASSSATSGSSGDTSVIIITAVVEQVLRIFTCLARQKIFFSKGSNLALPYRELSATHVCSAVVRAVERRLGSTQVMVIDDDDVIVMLFVVDDMC